MLNTLNSFEDLSDKSKSVVKSILDIINDFDKNNELEVFLFGSYAKGKVRVDSDIDLLILTHQTGLSPREIVKIKYNLEDFIQDNLEKYLDIDLKMYYVEDFYASSKQSIFEMEIAKYMIKIK